MLHFVILYVPFFNSVFSVAPLGMYEWQAVLVISLPIILVDEVMKWVSRTFIDPPTSHAAVVSEEKKKHSAEKFVENYYRSWGKNVARLYQDSSKVVWNGQGMSGMQFKQVLPELQKTFTHFEVRGFDAHQLGDSQVITVTGLVKYHKNVQFSQVFQVAKPGATTFIITDCFRLV
ncbi:hypothetical protein EC988_008744 [Linderina pennispora]|nr:hypothetical protein EC988_008744 [Linderina pennispora]